LKNVNETTPPLNKKRNTMKNAFFCIIALMLTSGMLFSQPVTFERTYGGVLNDSGVTVIQLPDSGFLIGGGTSSYGAGLNDIYLIRTDVNGDTIWTKTIGGPGREIFSSMIATHDSGYAIWATARDFGSNNLEFYLLKTDSLFDTLWTKKYAGVTSPNYLRYDGLYECSDHGFTLTGGKCILSDYCYGYTFRTDSIGNKRWESSYQNYFVYAGLEDSGNKDIIVSSQYQSATSRDIRLLFYNSTTGNLLNSIYYNNSNYWDEGYSMFPLKQGGYMISGYTGSSSYSYKPYLVRVDNAYNKLWQATFNSTDFDIASSPYGFKDYVMIQTADTGYALLGARTGNIKLIKTDSSGTVLWTKLYGGSGSEKPVSIKQTSDGGYVIVGYTNSFGAGGYDVYLIKTDSVGNVLTTSSPNNNLTSEKYSVYPNPSSGIITVDANNLESIEILDETGRRVLIIDHPDLGINEIDISNLFKGLYFCRIITNDGIYTSKFIFQ
jgi:hypothetical protein